MRDNADVDRENAYKGVEMRMFLVAVLFMAGIGALVMGGQFMSVAQSAVHEIEGMIAFLISVVAIGSAAIVLAVEKMREEISAAVNRGTTVVINEAKLAETKAAR